jgi:hypothetical protein
VRKLLIRILCVLITFRLGVGVYLLQRAPQLPPSDMKNEQPQPLEPKLPLPTYDGNSFSDLLTDNEALTYNGYLIESRYKTVPFGVGNQEENQGYVVLSKAGKLIRSFDGHAYHPLGNITAFGLFSFLGTTQKQIAIAQDVYRGGAQWIVDLSSTPAVVFDGPAWGVGRESIDCEVKDVDGDGVFEISLPITDFYALMDKMTVGSVPLPQITFKYDSNKRKYYPVNHILNRSTDSSEPDVYGESNELYVRSAIIGHMLELIYAGKRNKAWQYFDAAYNLGDKKEIERRVKDILRDQPVYKYIYNKH